MRVAWLKARANNCSDTRLSSSRISRKRIFSNSGPAAFHACTHCRIFSVSVTSSLSRRRCCYADSVAESAGVADLVAVARGPAPERWSAFAALARTGDVTGLQALTDFLQSRDCYVRRAALEAIGNHIQARTSAALIVPGLRDSSEFVVRTACEVAAKLGLYEAHDDLLKLLFSPLESTRQAALCALETLGQDKDFEAVLRVFASDPSKAVRKQAAWTLRSAATSWNWSRLFSLWYADEPPRHRQWACELAETFGDADVLPQLFLLSGDANGHVRKAAHLAAERIQARSRFRSQ